MTYRIYKTCYRIYKFCACKRFGLVYLEYFIYLCQQKVQEEMGGSGSGGGGGSSDSDSTPTLTMEQTPLTFEAAEAGAKVTFTVKMATGVEYSTDGKTWSPYTSAEAIELCRQFGCFSQCYTVIEHNLIAEVGQILRWQKFRRY